MSKPYPEHVKQQARAMYIPGVIGPTQISQQLGVPRGTIYRWLHPDYEQRQRARAALNKLKYRGSCLDCGAPTAYLGKDMRQSATRCLACHRIYLSANRKWNRDRIIAAIQRWHAEHGRRPTPRDWIRAGPDHPAVTGVYQGPNPIFPSWGDALRAAGYADVRFSPGPGKKMFDRREAQRLRQQMTDVAIAKHYGVTTKAIYAALGPRAITAKPKPKPGYRTAAERRQARIEALNRALANTPSA